MILFVLIISGIILTVCSGRTTLASESSETNDTQVPIAIAESKIITDGNLVPREYLDLAFAAGGEEAEVLVDEGDNVATGDVIARLSGSVESIKDLFEEKRGDITYTTRILVDEIDPRLRWGMTVVVTFEE